MCPTRCSSSAKPIPRNFRHPCSGTEVVEVVEVVETKTVGKVVIFRQWVTDPDGAECLADLVPRRSGVAMRSEYSMRQSLWGMHFEAAL
jgi:hypothetical protein